MMTDSQLLLSVEEAADQLRLGRTRTYELVKTRKIQSVKVGRRRLVVRSSLFDFADAAGGTGLRVVSSRVGRPNGNRVRRTGVQHRPSASRASGPTILDGESGKSGRWQATQQTDRHCCGRILTSRAHDPNRVAGQRKTGADFNSSVRGKPEAKLGHLVA